MLPLFPRWLLCALAWLSWACEAPRCATAACANGQLCDEASGQCRAAQTPTVAAPLLRGRPTWLAHASPSANAKASSGWVLAHAPLEHSLALLPATGGAPVWVAGPRAAVGESAAGESSAGAVDATGRLHLAWWRASDHTVWYAEGTPAQLPHDATPVAAAAAAPIALALTTSDTAVAWQSEADGRVRVSLRQGGVWQHEQVPQTPPVGGDGRKPGVALAMVALPTGWALAHYDAAGGDLVLATRTASGWKAARIAGRDPASGADQGDVGDTLAMATGPSGKLAIAYRDRSRGKVMLASSQGGVVSHTAVDGGLRLDPVTGLGRADLLGTSLAVALLADGRAVVAMQDASNLRIRLAIETPTGQFVVRPLAGNEAQAWPVLGAVSAAGLQLGWLALEPSRGPGGTWRSSTLQDVVTP
jgi:hypothetical protein